MTAQPSKRSALRDISRDATRLAGPAPSSSLGPRAPYDPAMGKPARRFVAQAQEDGRWRIRDKQQKRWWGPVFSRHPEELVAELNGDKRPERLTELQRRYST